MKENYVSQFNFTTGGSVHVIAWKIMQSEMGKGWKVGESHIKKFEGEW